MTLSGLLSSSTPSTVAGPLIGARSSLSRTAPTRASRGPRYRTPSCKSSRPMNSQLSLLTELDCSNQDDQLSLGKQNSNHARIFVSKWHHSMHDDRYTQFKNTCPPNSGADYRTNTFYFWSSDNLVHVDDIPCKWTLKLPCFFFFWRWKMLTVF